MNFKLIMISLLEDILVLILIIENLLKNELWPTAQKIEEMNENYEIPFET